MRLLKLTIVVMSLATLMFACPLSVPCPADRVDMHKVGEERSGWARLVIYQHRTSAGETHQVTVRCED